MKSTLFVSFAVRLLIARSVVLKHWILELSSADAIHAFFILAADSWGSIAASLKVEIDLTSFVCANLAGTCIIEEFSALFVESTHFQADYLLTACSQ